MISPELLRRYPFFGTLDDAQIKFIAMLSEEVEYPKNADIFQEGEEATCLYLLIDGCIDLYCKSEEEFRPQTRKEFPVGEINPGEIFGISSLIESSKMTATARVCRDSRLIKVDAVALRNQLGKDPVLGYKVMMQITKTALSRMAGLRIQLAAAWS